MELEIELRNFHLFFEKFQFRSVPRISEKQVPFRSSSLELERIWNFFLKF